MMKEEEYCIPYEIFLREKSGFSALGSYTAVVAMLMPKNCIAIYELLFKEGVMMAKKDVHVP